MTTEKPARAKRGKKKSKEEIFLYNKRRELRVLYGVSLEWHTEQTLAQMGVCYICKEPPPTRSLSVDHNHKTGVVRKLLCNRCNTAIGLCRESTQILQTMIAYLEEHG